VRQSQNRWAEDFLTKLLIVIIAAGRLGTTGPKPEEKNIRVETDSRRAFDAAVDRNIFLPSAETLPEGTFVINSYEIMWLGLSYGLTDYLQLSLTGALPVHALKNAFLGAKLKLHKSSNFVISTQATTGIYLTARNESGGFALGVLLDWIVDRDRNYVVSVSQHYATAYNWKEGVQEYRDLDFKTFHMSLTSVCLNARFARSFKVFVEALFILGEVEGDESVLMDEPFILNYGIRLASPKFSIDFSFLKPMTTPFEEFYGLGLPYLTFAVRL
jgi:hypothetical protein